MNKFNRLMDEAYDFFWRIRLILFVTWQCMLIFLFTLSFKRVGNYLKRITQMLKDIKAKRGDKQMVGNVSGDAFKEPYLTWHEGAIVDCGFVKDCTVVQRVESPMLHFYMETLNGAHMTYFPYKGNRSGWIDVP